MSLEKVKNQPGMCRRGTKYVTVVSYRGGDGAKRQKWITKSSLTAARDARRDFLNQLDRGIKPDGGRLSVAQVFEEWMKEVESNKRPNTFHLYRTMVTRHILPYIGGVKVAELTRDHLRDLYAKAPTKPTAKLTHAVLSSCMSWAAKDRGLIAVNPCGSVRPPKLERKEARHLDVADAKRMLTLVRGETLEPAVLLGLIGGLRIGEAVSLKWGDLALEAGSIIVRGRYWGPTKAGMLRSLTLPDEQIQTLRRWRTQQAQNLLLLGVAVGDSTNVVTDELGKPMNPQLLRTRFRTFCQKHGFDASFHSLRHTAAILMLLGGVDVRTAAGWLGHDPVLLLSTYSHYVQSGDRAAAEKVAALLTG